MGKGIDISKITIEEIIKDLHFSDNVKGYSEISFLFEPIYKYLQTELSVSNNCKEMMNRNLEYIYGHAQLMVLDSAILYLNHLYETNNNFSSFHNFLDYNSHKNGKQILLNFFSIYPELYRLLLSFFYKAITNFKLVENIIKVNLENIQKLFSVDKLTNIKINAGDRHLEAKSTVRLEFSNGKNLYLKWKKIDFEEKVSVVSKFMGNALKEQKTLIGDDWYIQEEIVQVPTDNLSGLYFNCGKLLFISYLLGMSDLHEGNIIISGNNVYIIDCETVFEVNHFIKDDIQGYDLGNSVYSTGLLPFRSFFGSIISGFNSRNKKIVYRKNYLIKVTSKGLVKVESRVTLSSDVHNKALNYNLDFLKHKKSFICGFEKSYRYFLENKIELQKFIKKIFENVEARTLVNNTYEYYKILANSYHPYLMMDSKKRKKYLLQSKMLNVEEVNAIFNDEIPFFTKRVKIEDSFWEKFSYDDLELQKRLIVKAFETEKNYFLSKENNAIEKKDAIQSYVNFLLAKYLTIDNNIVWLDEVYIGDDEYTDYRLIVSPDNLYMGIGGILLLLSKYLSQYLNNEVEIFLEKLYDNYFAKVKHTIENYPMSLCGFFDGTSGMIYALYVANKKIDRNHNSIFIDLLSKVVDNIVYDTKYDVVSGAAGLLNVLCRIFNDIVDPVLKCELFKLIEKTQYFIISNYSKEEKGWQTDDSGEYYFGYAHGSAGIVSNLYKAYTITKFKPILKIVDEVVEKMLFEYSVELEGNWPISKGKKENCYNWCHGSPGIILFFSELYENGYRKIDLRTIVKKCLTQIIESSDDKEEFCLCHGKYGNYLIIQRSLKIFGFKNFDNSSLNQRLEKVRDVIFTKENFNKFPKSFMTGLAGIYYYELCH